MTPRQLVKSLLPPVIANALRNRDGIHFTGDFATWSEAERASTGYASSNILEKTRAAMLKVKNHEAAYERDSVIFPEAEYPFPVIAGLLRAALEQNNRLSVLDFGGALGSSYFQCRSFLSAIKQMRWSVVEQPAHVQCGAAEFANEQLRFYEKIEDCVRAEAPNVLLLSSVVQYLPNPYDFLVDTVSRDFDYIIVDRTGFLSSGRDRLTVQHVPEWIYPAVYPCWFFGQERFIGQFDRRYAQVASFPALDTAQPEGGAAEFKGFIFKLKKQP